MQMLLLNIFIMETCSVKLTVKSKFYLSNVIIIIINNMVCLNFWVLKTSMKKSF